WGVFFFFFWRSSWCAFFFRNFGGVGVFFLPGPAVRGYFLPMFGGFFVLGFFLRFKGVCLITLGFIVF
ncbi:hypothetical protein ACNIRP_25085, partial [Escherichia coli]